MRDWSWFHHWVSHACGITGSLGHSVRRVFWSHHAAVVLGKENVWSSIRRVQPREKPSSAPSVPREGFYCSWKTQTLTCCWEPSKACSQFCSPLSQTPVPAVSLAALGVCIPQGMFPGPLSEDRIPENPLLPQTDSQGWLCEVLGHFSWLFLLLASLLLLPSYST